MNFLFKNIFFLDLYFLVLVLDTIVAYSINFQHFYLYTILNFNFLIKEHCIIYFFIIFVLLMYLNLNYILLNSIYEFLIVFPNHFFINFLKFINQHRFAIFFTLFIQSILIFNFRTKIKYYFI